jgi:hypothetical protein
MSRRKKLRGRESGDRFIPRRRNFDVNAANFYISRTEEMKELLVQVSTK